MQQQEAFLVQRYCDRCGGNLFLYQYPEGEFCVECLMCARINYQVQRSPEHGLQSCALARKRMAALGLEANCQGACPFKKCIYGAPCLVRHGPQKHLLFDLSNTEKTIDKDNLQKQ